MKLEYPQKYDGLFILSKSDIEAVAYAVLSEYQPEALALPTPVDLDAIAKDNLGLSVESRYLSGNGYILGATVFESVDLECADETGEIKYETFEKGTILIDLRLYETDHEGKKRFTYAHEISHWLLDQDAYARKRNTCGIAGRCAWHKENQTQSNWEEWQANALASAMLMPLATFDTAVGKALGIPCGKGKYCTDGSGGTLCETAKKISRIYNVSISAAGYRLRQLGYVRPIDIFAD